MKKLIEIIEQEMKIPNLQEILDYINSIPVNEIIDFTKLIGFSKLASNDLRSLLSILKREDYLTIKYKVVKVNTYYNSLTELVKDFPDYDLNTVQLYFKRNIKKEVEAGDYIVFEFNNDLQVADVTKVYSDKVLIHFLDSYKGDAEFINFENILGKGNSNGMYKLHNWSGNYDIYDFENQLIKFNLYHK